MDRFGGLHSSVHCENGIVEMSLLAENELLSWHETKPYLEKLKCKGIEEFIQIYANSKNRLGDSFKWGDEIEYLIVKFDHENKRACVSLRASEILRQLMKTESKDQTENEFLWRPEFAEYMIEGTPDDFTPQPFREDFSTYGDESGEARNQALDNHVYMDATGFGNGCCCLQVTLQASNIDEARFLYDQLAPITPIMMALSAGTPMFRGYLTDMDCRWNVISVGSDDRTEEERGLRPLNEQKFHLSEGRHGTIKCYLDRRSCAYNDVHLQYDENHFTRLIEAGVDKLMAQHIAHLFIRDPLQVFRDNAKNEEIGDNEYQCFEDVQSSNWMNIRFKPPPPDTPSIGWRVEFRSMEVQLTDFENAAYACFIILLTRVILSSGLCFLIPISKLHENMRRAQTRDAVLKEKFYFRRFVDSGNSNTLPDEVDHISNSRTDQDDPSITPSDYVEMSVDEIINGKPSCFPGLIPLMYRYLDSIDADIPTRYTIQQYLQLIQKRATGEFWTLARFMRELVNCHRSYKRDSTVSDEVCHDVMATLRDITSERACCPKLNGLGPNVSNTSTVEKKYSGGSGTVSGNG